MKKIKEKSIALLKAEKITAEAVLEATTRPKDVLLKYKELARKAVRENTEYKKLISARNSAHLASLDYLYKKDKRLLNLKKILDEK